MNTSKPILAYHFVGAKLRDGRPVPADGVWLEHNDTLRLCHRGLHASLHVADAVRYAPGTTLCLVDLAGDIVHGDDKLCASRRRIVVRFDATELLRADARASAMTVIHLWKAPSIVREYLETGREDIRLEARQAAYAYGAAYADAADAADAAAAYAADAAADAAAAYAAACAAYAAAYAAYAADADADRRKVHIAAARQRLADAVNAKFASIGVL